MKIRILSAALVLAVFSGWSLAAVPDPQIMTDHPVYRGELACSTLDRNIADAYRVFKDRYGREPANDSEKLVALWVWKCEHGVHSAENFVYVGPDHMEAHKDGRSAGWMDNRDCQMNQFSFGFALCYSIHAQMNALVSRALGNDPKRVRCPLVDGHTPFEAFVDGKWALADFTTGMMVFGDDGKPLAIDEIKPHVNDKDKAWLDSPKRGGFGKFAMLPYPDNWDVYGVLKEHMMLFGYNAMPIAYTLRSGESFTRYLEPGLEDGKTFMFWAKDYYNLGSKPFHGPYRHDTFLDDYPMGNGKKGRQAIRQSNGVFEYNVPLDGGKYKDGAFAESNATFADGVLRAGPGAPGSALSGRAAGSSYGDRPTTQPAAGASAQKKTVGFSYGQDPATKATPAVAPAGNGQAGSFVIFEHTSPYIIAAWPEKKGDREWDLLTEHCVDGAVAAGQAVGKVPVSVSIDGGQTWKDAGQAEGAFKVDFTDIVKGRHSYLVKFGLTPADGLKALGLRTVVQVARGVVPRLKDGGTKVTYQASGQGVIHGGPSQYISDGLRRKDLESEGVRVMEIKAPGAIKSASAMLRASGPTRGPWSVEFSLDGQTWKPGAKDVTLEKGESGWGGGHHAYAWGEMDFAANKDARTVLARVGKGNLSHAEIYATYERPVTSSLEVTYAWTEAGQPKQDTRKIDPGKLTDSWTVPTGKDVKTKWVRFAAK